MYIISDRLSSREIPRAPPSGFPSGSGDISSYTPPLVTIQLQWEIQKKILSLLLTKVKARRKEGFGTTIKTVKNLNCHQLKYGKTQY